MGAFRLLIAFIMCCNAMLYADDKKVLNQEDRKEAIVQCANYHLEFCDKLLDNPLPSVSKCDVRGECEFVGWLYSQVQEYELSLPYFHKACKANHIESCDKLGISYQRLGNYKKAKKFHKLACESNHISACYNLATLYYEGLGVRHSYQNANTYYQKVCNLREGIGCLHLAMSYAKGHGVIKNIERAKELFSKACELGNNDGCNFYDEYSNEVTENKQ